MRKHVSLPRIVAAATAVAVVAATTGAAIALTGTASGIQAGRARASANGAVPVGAHGRGGAVVTLVTGDVVTVLASGTQSGQCPQVSVVPAVKTSVVARLCRPDGHLRVIPSDAAPLIGTVLDPELFDVTALIANGYDDAHSAQTPLIVQYADQNGAMRAASGRSDAGFGGRLQQRKTLGSIRGVAGQQPKGEAAGMRAVLSDLGNSRNPAGITRIMLDRRVSVAQGTAASGTSTTSADLEQIGVPQAWRDGVTGKGVRVAVLDTGIDGSHPDLVGRVVEAADFTGSGSTQDQVGHGTHVAGTIVGSGAASGGVHRGVAPDAQLVVGRVVDGSGTGTESEAIAGMEWAASRASIVNMSLGFGTVTDGPDPTVEAVEQLTKQYGTLFVTAAGNYGPFEQTIVSPGAAPSALTVGAVDGTGTVADFSSRGPTAAAVQRKPDVLNAGLLKPDLLAPGVDIVSARAKGTSYGRIIDANSIADSGTSMAAPHVAGAAALLKQRRPDWTGSQLKAGLTGTANPVKGGDPYVTGTGIVDVALAIDGPVSTSSTVELGVLAYPQTGSTSTELGYANPTDRAARLSLAVTAVDRGGKPLPAGAVALAAPTLDLPAGAKASVAVTVDQRLLDGRTGYHTATVTATDQRGKVLTTLVAFQVEGPSSTLTLRADEWQQYRSLGVHVNAAVVNLDDPTLFATSVDVPNGGTAAIRVPNGRYSIIGTVLAGPMYSTLEASAGALVGDPDMVIAKDTEVALDATAAPEITVAVEGVETRTDEMSIDVMQTGPRGLTWGAIITKRATVGGPVKLFAAPMATNPATAPVPAPAATPAPASAGTLETAIAASLRQPGDQPSPYAYDLIRTAASFPTDGRWVVGRDEQAKLAQVHQRFHHLDIDGATARHGRYGMTPWGDYLEQAESIAVPDTRTDYLTPGVWLDQAFSSGLRNPSFTVAEPPRTVVAGGSETKEWNRQPLHTDWLEATDGISECQPGPITRTSGNLHVMLAPLVDVHGRYDCWLEPEINDRYLALYRDGRKVGEANDWVADLPMSPGAATYRLTFDERFSVPRAVAKAVNTVWTFRSAGPPDERSMPVAMLALDYDLGLTQANRSAGGPATITVRQASGTDPQQITAAEVSTSTDDGATWTAAPVTVAQGTSTSNGSFQTTLPTNAPGSAISLRVKVVASAGSEIEQTMIRAYRAA